MKIFIVMLLTFAVSSFNASAFDIKDLRSIAKGADKSLDKKIDKIITKVEKKIDKKVAKYEKKIAEVENSFDRIKDLKNKAEFYLKIAKIVIAILSSGILLLIFVVWRVWSNVSGMRRVIENVANYKDVEKRLQALEQKVG